MECTFPHYTWIFDQTSTKQVTSHSSKLFNAKNTMLTGVLTKFFSMGQTICETSVTWNYHVSILACSC